MRYLRSIFSLLPPGLFSFHYSENLKKLLTPFAEEFQRIEDYLQNSFRNLFPQNSDNRNLQRWGTLLGVNAPTIDDLRRLIDRQLKKSGGATIGSFLSHLEDLGINGEVEDVLPYLDPFNCNSTCNDTAWGDSVDNAFGLVLPVDKQFFNCNSRCDASLVQNQKDEVLQYLIGASPGHSRVVFFYHE